MIVRPAADSSFKPAANPAVSSCLPNTRGNDTHTSNTTPDATANTANAAADHPKNRRGTPQNGIHPAESVLGACRRAPPGYFLLGQRPEGDASSLTGRAPSALTEAAAWRPCWN